jgi:hypothetical protein
LRPRRRPPTALACPSHPPPPQVAGRPVPTPLMNVLLRAIARLKDNANAAARAFEAFHLYGAAHNVDSYNCVMESCAAAGKVRGVAWGGCIRHARPGREEKRALRPTAFLRLHP